VNIGDGVDRKDNSHANRITNPGGDGIDRGEQDGLTSDQQARLRELERDNTRLRMERDLLKRTVAFWVKETSTP
jgi:transposase-like protein